MEEEGKPQIKMTRQQEGKTRPQLVPQQKVEIERQDQTNLNLAPPRPIPSARSTKVGTVKSATGVRVKLGIKSWARGEEPQLIQRLIKTQ